MSMALRHAEVRIVAPAPAGRRPDLTATGVEGRRRCFLLIDSQAMVRHGLALTLQAAHAGASTHEADGLDGAIRMAARGVVPDLIVLDAASLGNAVEEELHRLKAAFRGAPVVLTASAPDVGLARACLLAGARAFLLKSDAGAVLEHTVALLLSGEGYVPLPGWMIGTAPAATVRPAPTPDAALKRLTMRQRDIFKLLLAGYSNKEIARSLGVLEGTVKVHVRAMMQKLGAVNRTQVAVMAARCGIRPDA